MTEIDIAQIHVAIDGVRQSVKALDTIFGDAEVDEQDRAWLINDLHDAVRVMQKMETRLHGIVH